jgi:hypothetical protein
LKAHAQNYLDKADVLHISIGVCWNFTLYLASGILGSGACIFEGPTDACSVVVVGSSEVLLYICQTMQPHEGNLESRFVLALSVFK